MAYYRTSRRIYITDDKSTKICVQRNEDRYEAMLVRIGGAKQKRHGNRTFDTIKECQDFIDAEAIINKWRPAKISGSVLY